MLAESALLPCVLQTRMAHSSYDYMFGKPALRFLMDDYLQVSGIHTSRAISCSNTCALKCLSMRQILRGWLRAATLTVHTTCR